MTDYYVKNAGNDGNTGLSDGQAWQTMNQVNISSFSGDDNIYFNKADEWREQLTVPSSGSSGSPITFGAYGSGSDPIINGADVVATWSASGAWQTAWDLTYTNAFSDTNQRNYRNRMLGNTSSYSGTKIRATVTADGTGSAVIDGCSIGVSTYPDYDSAPTRITWDTGNNGVTISSGASEVSDEITFTFTKTVEHCIHFFVSSRDNHQYTSGASATWNANADETLTEDISGTGSSNTMLLDKLEVYTGTTNVWQATLTTQPEMVFFNESGTITWGDQKASTAACVNKYDWYWNSNVLYTYSTTDPDSAYTSIEASVRNQGILIGSGGTHSYITVDGLEIKYTAADGVIVASGSSNNAIVQNCTIHHIGDNGSSKKGDGIEFQGTSDNQAINNDVSECGRHGIFVCGYSTSADDNIIEFNTVYDHWYGAIDCLVDSGSPSSLDGTIIRYNYIYNSGSGDFPAIHQKGNTSSVTNTEIYYNICRDIDDHAIKIQQLVTGLTIYNNTIADTNVSNTAGIYLGNGTGTVTIKNNVIYEPQTYAMDIADSTNKTVDYNCLYQSGGFSAKVDGSARNWAYWQGTLGWGANSTTSDPVFMSP